MRRLVFERENLLHKKCPECGSLHLVVDNNLGEIVCENCGFIISSNLNDRKQEWRAFTLEENQKKARTGPHSPT